MSTPLGWRIASSWPKQPSPGRNRKCRRGGWSSTTRRFGWLCDSCCPFYCWFPCCNCFYYPTTTTTTTPPIVILLLHRCCHCHLHGLRSGDQTVAHRSAAANHLRSANVRPRQRCRIARQHGGPLWEVEAISSSKREENNCSKGASGCKCAACATEACI